MMGNKSELRDYPEKYIWVKTLWDAAKEKTKHLQNSN